MQDACKQLGAALAAIVDRCWDSLSIEQYPPLGAARPRVQCGRLHFDRAGQLAGAEDGTTIVVTTSGPYNTVDQTFKFFAPAGVWFEIQRTRWDAQGPVRRYAECATR